MFPLIVACNVWNHEFKNPWINAFCRNHENWCQQIKVLSQNLTFTSFILGTFTEPYLHIFYCGYFHRTLPSHLLLWVVYPSMHSHLKLPGVLWHLECGGQSCVRVAHSPISIKLVKKKGYWCKWTWETI
jgi:hypothetical protein